MYTFIDRSQPIIDMKIDPKKCIWNIKDMLFY